VYAHWLPDASRRDVDRLDTLQQSASLAHPEDGIDDQAIAAKFFGLSGEPHFRQFEPARRVVAAGRSTAPGRVSRLGPTRKHDQL
jgi:hypothetical protein